MLADYTQAAGSLAIELAGTSPGSGHDVLAVGGSASLNSIAGTLTVTTNGGFAPVAGNTFTVLTAAVVSGTFATTNLPPLAPATLGWTVQYTASAVILSVTSAPTGYNAWSNLYVLAQGPTGDDDLDGYANLLEYVTGGNPTNSDALASMNAARTGGVFALKFTRDTNTTDATIIVQGNNNVTNELTWIGLATNLLGSWGSATNVLEAASTNAAIVAVTAYDTDPAATNRFLRLRVKR